MITVSRTIIRNAHSGAAGNQTIWATALTATKKTPATRAAELPVMSPTPVSATTEPRIKWIQPQVVMSKISAPVPPTTTTSSLRIAAKPQKASSDPRITIITPANAIQPEYSAPAGSRDV